MSMHTYRYAYPSILYVSLINNNLFTSCLVGLCCVQFVIAFMLYTNLLISYYFYLYIYTHIY